jgi:SagB-type dehydrogenase family enzyme
MLIVTLSGKAIPTRNPEGGDTRWFKGTANQLSDQQILYPRIDEIHASTKSPDQRRAAEASPTGCGDTPLVALALSTRAFGDVVRQRRSALDFRGGDESMSLSQLSAALAATAQPLCCDFGGTRFIQLYLYVHRVDGLQRGVYRYWPENAALERIRLGDQRVAAAGLSLGQDLAGNACVAFSMVGDVDRAVHAHGNRGYRYVHFEAGAMGQRLYLAAEAVGLAGTGIGAFFDAQVHRYLNLDAGQKAIYHFAIGHPVPDPRLAA